MGKIPPLPPLQKVTNEYPHLARQSQSYNNINEKVFNKIQSPSDNTIYIRQFI